MAVLSGNYTRLGRDNTMPEGKHIWPRENWYRDLWLLIVTGFVVLALISVKEAQDKVDQASRVKSAVICQNVTRTDKQTLTNLHTKVDQELIKNLHLTQKQVDDQVHKQLVLSAEERRALRPSAPAGSCFPGITTLQTNIVTGEISPKA